MSAQRPKQSAERCAIVVGFGPQAGGLGPLIRQIAVSIRMDWVLVADLSSCLYRMAQREADLLLMPRAAAANGEAVLQTIARCRPNFRGCLIIADEHGIDVYLDPGAGHGRWLIGPLARFCAELGWSMVHHPLSGESAAGQERASAPG